MSVGPIKKYYEYKHEANFYKQKYEEINHLYEHFKTQFAPGHFYSPYPDLTDIELRKDQIFNRQKIEIPGIDIRETQQLKLLNSLSKFYKELPYKKNNTGLRYSFGLHAFSYTDAIFLFCMLNYLRPKRVVEIGSGFSSALMLDVNEKFFKNKIDLTFIEPYPELFLSFTKPGDEENYTLIDKPLHELDSSVFKKLNKGDVLFVDSTHVSKAGSDVNQIIFDILPSLKEGVIIHIHDIFYPFEYPYEWIKETRAWNEDYLVRAFLYNNKSYEILLFNDFLNAHHKNKVNKLFPLAKKNSGGSLWLKKVGR